MALVPASDLHDLRGLGPGLGPVAQFLAPSDAAFCLSLVLPIGASAAELPAFEVGLSDVEGKPYASVAFERRALTPEGVLFVATAARSAAAEDLPPSASGPAAESLPPGGP